MEQLMLDDMRSLTQVQELEQIRIMAEILSRRSGEQLVYDSLARDVSVDPKTAKKWVFEVRPWFRNVENSIRKTPKWYLRDWSRISDAGKRCETMVACHVARDGEPWFLAEVQSSDTHVSPCLGRFQRITGAKHAFQVVFNEPYVAADCFSRMDPVVVPAKTFLSQLL